MEVRHRQTRQTDPKGSRNRLCLVGPFGCGKTSLRSTFSGKSFAEKQHRVTIACQTICVQFPTEERPAEAGVNVIVDDTSGEERFRNMLTVNFVRHAQCVLLCFDLSSEDSLTEAQDTWLPWLTDQGRCGQSAVMLVGLKADLRYAVSSEHSNKTPSHIDLTEDSDRGYTTTIPIVVGAAAALVALSALAFFLVRRHKPSEKTPQAAELPVTKLADNGRESSPFASQASVGSTGSVASRSDPAESVESVDAVNDLYTSTDLVDTAGSA
ncbi:hypothetical protein ACOMHN_013312 [Nucella lapillus]